MAERVRVRIFGDEYVIKGDLSAEEIQKLAGKVDELMSGFHASHPNLPRHKLAILAAINLAEEVERLERERRELMKLLEEAR